MDYNINDYANCMFRYEKLPAPWIASCRDYLVTQFPNIEGKVVLDYAFGRGNWTLAFLQAGAKKVYAIDASLDNVRRFSEHCRQHYIENVEIIHGNFLEASCHLKCDILWIYGVLNHIQPFDLFINECMKCAEAHSLFYIYHYNKGSVREFIVESCRRLVTYADEQHFRDDILMYQRPARIRARDDLTSHFIRWLSATDMQARLRSAGLYTYSKQNDFESFLRGRQKKEFAPHQLLCGFDKKQEIELVNEYHYKDEIAVLQAFFADLEKSTDQDERRELGLGIFNTYFTNLEYSETSAIVETFLHMAFALQLKNDHKSFFSNTTLEYLSLIEQSLNDVPRTLPPGLSLNLLTTHLINNRIRL